MQANDSIMGSRWSCDDSVQQSNDVPSSKCTGRVINVIDAEESYKSPNIIKCKKKYDHLIEDELPAKVCKTAKKSPSKKKNKNVENKINTFSKQQRFFSLLACSEHEASSD